MSPIERKPLPAHSPWQRDGLSHRGRISPEPPARSQVDLSDIFIRVERPEDDIPPPLPARPARSAQVHARALEQEVSQPLPLSLFRIADRRSKVSSDLLAGTSTAFKWLFDTSTSTVKDARTEASLMLQGIPDTLKSTKIISSNLDTVKDLLKLRKGQSGLCSSCAKLPLDQCFTGASNVSTPYLHWNSYLSSIVRHGSWCELCKIIIHMLCRQQHDPVLVPYVQERVVEDWLKGVPFRTWMAEGKIREHIIDHKFPISAQVMITVSTAKAENPGLLQVEVKAMIDRPYSEWPRLSHFTLRAVRQGLSVTCRPQENSSYAHVLDPAWINLSLAKMWLSDCECHHGKRCSEQGWAAVIPTPNFIRLIDVIDLRVVGQDSDSSLRFVALSYVWGGANTLSLTSANVEEFSRVCGLRPHLSKIPRTILDAMQVVRSVGERHLWCDALCIMQEASAESQEQIDNMDRVYGSALFTIVAASGENAQAGLPGVTRTSFPDVAIDSVPRSTSQPLTTLEDSMSVVAPYTRPEAVSTSPKSWDSRAWTFQERLLSRRLLIFSGGEMAWHCPTRICREDMSPEQSGYAHTPLRWLSLQARQLGVNVTSHWKDGHFEVSRHGQTFLVRSATFAEYATMVGQYSRRSMTFEGDVLNALAGLLRIFSRAFRSEYAAGLPSVLLDVALLWRAVRPLRRRTAVDMFPSWSWAGWEGEVAYHQPVSMPRDDTGQTVETEGVRPLLRYFVLRARDASLQPLNGTSRGLPLANDDVPAEWEASYSALIRTFPVPGLRDLDPRVVRSLSGSHLIFYTSVVDKFEIVEIRESDSIRHEQSIVLDQLATAVEICFGESSEARVTDTKLILLAEASGLLADDHRNTSEYDRYLVMLVREDPETGLTSRCGIGTVLKSSWSTADPVTELICLA